MGAMLTTQAVALLSSAASSSRLRGGAAVTRAPSNSRAALATPSPRAKAMRLAFEGQ